MNKANLSLADARKWLKLMRDNKVKSFTLGEMAVEFSDAALFEPVKVPGPKRKESREELDSIMFYSAE